MKSDLDFARQFPDKLLGKKSSSLSFFFVFVFPVIISRFSVHSFELSISRQTPDDVLLKCGVSGRTMKAFFLFFVLFIWIWKLLREEQTDDDCCVFIFGLNVICFVQVFSG